MLCFSLVTAWNVISCHIEFIFFNMSQCEQQMNCSCAIWAKQSRLCSFFFFLSSSWHLFCLFLFGADDEQLLNGQYLELFLYVHFNNGPNCLSVAEGYWQSLWPLRLSSPIQKVFDLVLSYTFIDSSLTKCLIDIANNFQFYIPFSTPTIKFLKFTFYFPSLIA